MTQALVCSVRITLGDFGMVPTEFICWAESLTHGIKIVLTAYGRIRVDIEPVAGVTMETCKVQWSTPKSNIWIGHSAGTERSVCEHRCLVWAILKGFVLTIGLEPYA